MMLLFDIIDTMEAGRVFGKLGYTLFLPYI